jgi:hypothetical protein
MRTNVDILLFARDMQSRRYMPTVAELAVIYRVHRRTIYRWLDDWESVDWPMPSRRRETAA